MKLEAIIEVIITKTPIIVIALLFVTLIIINDIYLLSTVYKLYYAETVYAWLKAADRYGSCYF
jgi:hypothetical protein